jgi:hypothetical protein
MMILLALPLNMALSLEWLNTENEAIRTVANDAIYRFGMLFQLYQ